MKKDIEQPRRKRNKKAWGSRGGNAKYGGFERPGDKLRAISVMA